MFKRFYNIVPKITTRNYCTNVEKLFLKMNIQGINIIKNKLTNIPIKDREPMMCNICLATNSSKFFFKFNKQVDLVFVKLNTQVDDPTTIHEITYPETNIIHEPYEKNLIKIVNNIEKNKYHVKNQTYVGYYSDYEYFL